LNKIIKTFQITVFVVLAFFLTGQYIISALHMILLLFLTDFVTLSISTDRVRYSGRPDSWNIAGLVKAALSLGILVIGELIFLLQVGIRSFGLFSNIAQLHTFTFEMLIFLELLDVLIIRERRHFWNSWPSRFLLFAIAGDLILVFLISILGMPGVAPISPMAALTVAAFSLVFALAINDPIKAWLIQKFWVKP
jgi:H+-transporting ATPase